MHHITRRRFSPSPIIAGLAALALFALFAAAGSASASSAPKSGSWTKLLDRPISADRLGLPAATSAPRLARAALRHSAMPLKLHGSLNGLRLLPETRMPKVAGARDVRTLRFRQTVGGLRVLYSQIDVAVVEDVVTSITATVVPVKAQRLLGAKRVSAAQARAIARRRITGPDTALEAQPIADAGTPGRPRPPRRAWVVQVTPASQPDKHADSDRNLCVVIDAQTGKVLDVWEGVAARPRHARRVTAATSPAASAAQASETRLALVRDANFAPGAIGIGAFATFTSGNPFLWTDDIGGFPIERRLQPATGDDEPGEAAVDLRNVPKHMCTVRGFCGRDGGFDGTINTLSVTARAPTQSNPPQNDRGTRYRHSDQRVFIASQEAGSADILAHEFGHQMDLTYAEDRIANVQGREIQEALADMYAYDFDRADTTLGESEPAVEPGEFIGSPRINWANPGVLTNDTENAPFPAHISNYRCNASEEHFNGTILSHAYHLMVINIGHDLAGAVVHLANQRLPAQLTYGLLRETFERAGEDLGGDAENAVDAAFNQVGVKDATNPCS